MNLTEFSVKNQIVIWLSVVLLIMAGIASYEKLGKLEDPEFTIKTALVITQYPGAGPIQVEQEVTERIEIAIQEIPEIDYVESISRTGLSIVKIEIDSQFWSDQLPQIWDTLRRKVRNVEDDLPIGASRPDIRDDFGNVYGFLLAITGDGYSYDELEQEAKNLKRQLSLVDDVARVEYWGKQTQAVYLQVKESRLKDLSISYADIAATLNQQNSHRASGNVYFDQQSARIEVTGNFVQTKDIGELIIRDDFAQSGQLIRIKDIANIKVGSIEPAQQIMRFNGEQAIGLAIANIDGSNIVTLGENLEQRLNELQADIPIGIEVHKVAWQAEEVKKAIDSFLISLVEAVVIVLVVLTLFMGWRMGVIIGTALVLTILGTLIIMALFGIDLQRMSLGALVIALGMMVDNAIVVGDGVIARMREGKNKVNAVIDAARGPSIPLLGATVIAVLAFYPIGGSKEDVGEYCLSLFQVVGISLLFSWIISMTVTPLQCLYMLKVEEKDEEESQFNSSFYVAYRRLLENAIKYRSITLSLMFGALLAAGWGFKYVPQLFFPDSSRPQFMIDMYATTGTRVAASSEILAKAEQHVAKLPGVDSVSTFIASGPPRFYLPVEPELFFPSYGQLIVNVDDYKKIDDIAANLRVWLKDNFTEVPTFRVRKYGVGPAETWKFELRVSAPPEATPMEIRSIGERGLAMLKGHSMVADSTTDWRQLAAKVVVDYDQDKAQFVDISRNDVANATQRVFDGLPLGQLRDSDELRPILLRSANEERETPSSIYTIQIPQSHRGGAVPLSQTVDGVSLEWEDPFIWRRDRQRTITIQAEPIQGVTLEELRADLKEEIATYEASLPLGYKMEWGAEAESSADAQASLIPGVIPAVVLMVLIIVALFNAMKPAIIIFTVIPLAVIGITIGLLTTGAPFGFMALLGALSLMGMMIKNAIVLLDEINHNIYETNLSDYESVIQAGLSRLSPVALAAATTILGVIPLIQDVFWVSMAVTIMAGLTFGTILTMVMVPVLYCMFYNVKPDETSNSQAVYVDKQLQPA